MASRAHPGIQSACAKHWHFAGGADPNAASLPHVLFIIDHLAGVGGGEGALLRLARHLPRDRYRCSVATFWIRPDLPVFDDFPCPLHVFPLRKTHDWNAFRVAARLARLIRREDVRLVHTFFETSNVWAGTVAKLLTGTPLVSSRRDMGILRTRKHRLGYLVANRLCDRVVAVSETVRELCVQREGIDPGRVKTLHNGIELEAVRAAAPDVERLRAWGLSPESPIVATVANLRRVKGVDVFIRAAARVAAVQPRARFLVAGGANEPAYADELKDLARSLGIEKNVLFLGAQGNVPSLLKASQVFCMLSRSEGFSNALLEAMACGLPCVATRVGGNGEALADGVNGFLVESEDDAAAARRVLHLLECRDAAARLGLAARRTVEERFSMDAIARNLAAIYDDLLLERGARTARPKPVRRSI